jgi:hypothetical protein
MPLLIGVKVNFLSKEKYVLPIIDALSDLYDGV